MWRTGTGVYEQRVLTDLEDTAERIVSLCEELDSGQAAAVDPEPDALVGAPQI
jgi:hypothetical protein